jgi:hypothetical protein
MRPVTRITPALPNEAFKTYQVTLPKATHWRPATCEESDCAAFLGGWKTVVPGDSAQAAYIRTQSGRSFTETRQDAGLTEFAFPAGQRCFASDKHMVPVGREPLYIVRNGDWRATRQQRSSAYRHTSADSWVDDFATHQEKLAHAVGQRG